MELLKLKRRDHEPTGGWRFIDEDGFQTVAGNFMQLVEQASRHRAGNDISIPPNFPAIVEDWICRHVPSSFLQPPSNGKYPDPPLTSSVVRMATEAVLYKWIHSGRARLQSDNHARERAEICLDCPMNVGAAACANCHGLDGWIRGYIGRNPEIIKGLFACRAGGGLNMLYVWMPDEVIRTTLNAVQRPRHPEKCWKLKL